MFVISLPIVLLVGDATPVQQLLRVVDILPPLPFQLASGKVLVAPDMAMTYCLETYATYYASGARNITVSTIRKY
jgi:hypothetical protein